MMELCVRAQGPSGNGKPNESPTCYDGQRWSRSPKCWDVKKTRKRETTWRVNWKHQLYFTTDSDKDVRKSNRWLLFGCIYSGKMFRDGENSRMMMNNGTSASASSINPNKSVCLLLVVSSLPLSIFLLFLCLPVLRSLPFTFGFMFIMIRKWLQFSSLFFADFENHNNNNPWKKSRELTAGNNGVLLKREKIYRFQT